VPPLQQMPRRADADDACAQNRDLHVMPPKTNLKNKADAHSPCDWERSMGKIPSIVKFD
jgi:hypothetical protein